MPPWRLAGSVGGPIAGTLDARCKGSENSRICKFSVNIRIRFSLCVNPDLFYLCGESTFEDMDKKELFLITEDILGLFRGLRDGTICYHYDNLNSAMKTNICEVLSEISETVVWNVDSGVEVTRERVQELHDNLIAFSDDFKVKEAKTIAARIKTLLDNSK